jgi:hypothetical protein
MQLAKIFPLDGLLDSVTRSDDIWVAGPCFGWLSCASRLQVFDLHPLLIHSVPEAKDKQISIQVSCLSRMLSLNAGPWLVFQVTNHSQATGQLFGVPMWLLWRSPRLRASRAKVAPQAVLVHCLVPVLK